MQNFLPLNLINTFNENTRKKLRLVIFFTLDVFILAYYAAAFYPGYLTDDSLYMLFQTTGILPLSNWHPMFITLLWGGLFNIYKSAGGIWLIQVLAFILSIHLLSSNIRNFFVAIAGYLLLTLAPPIFTNMAALWKDCWAVMFSIFAFSFLISLTNNKNLLNLSFCIFFCLLSVLTRIDYFVIIAPVLLGGFILYNEKKSWSLRKIFIRSFFALICVILVLLIILNNLNRFADKKLNNWTPVAVWDISGVRHFSHVDIDGYNCTTSDPLVFGKSRPIPINLPQEPLRIDVDQERRNVFAVWFDSVTSNPVAYIKHRMCVAKVFMGLASFVHYPYPPANPSNHALTQKSERSSLNKEIYWYFDEHHHGLWFQYWVYLLLGAVTCLVFFIFRKLNIIQVVLALSTLGSVSRILVLPAADFRYGLWILLSTLILMILSADRALDLICARLQRKK